MALVSTQKKLQGTFRRFPSAVFSKGTGGHRYQGIQIAIVFHDDVTTSYFLTGSYFIEHLPKYLQVVFFWHTKYQTYSMPYLVVLAHSKHNIFFSWHAGIKKMFYFFKIL